MRSSTFSRGVGIRNIHGLQGCHNLLAIRLSVWLNDRQTQRCRPNDGGHLLFFQAFVGEHILDATFRF